MQIPTFKLPVNNILHVSQHRRSLTEKHHGHQSEFFSRVPVNTVFYEISPLDTAAIEMSVRPAARIKSFLAHLKKREEGENNTVS